MSGVDTPRSQDWSFSLGQSAEDRDGDQDGLVDSRDNCPDIGNPLESDMDDDTTGDPRDDLDGDGLRRPGLLGDDPFNARESVSACSRPYK